MISKDEVSYQQPEIAFYYDGEYQFNIDNEVEMTNIRILAADRNCWDKIEFRWKDHIIKMTEKYDLTKWPLGMYDSMFRQFRELIDYKLNKHQGEPKLVRE